MLRHLAAAAALCLAADAASATPFTYDINFRFPSYDNPGTSGNEIQQGGILNGTVTLNQTLSGDARVIDYNLTSFLRCGDGFPLSCRTRDSEYIFGYTGTSGEVENTFSYTGDLLVLEQAGITQGGTFDGFKAWRHRLTLDNILAAPASLTADASERFDKCSGTFVPFPQNPCGGTAGTYGSNGQGELTATASSTGEGGPTGAEIPLPAALPLMGLGLAALGVAARRRRT